MSPLKAMLHTFVRDCVFILSNIGYVSILRPKFDAGLAKFHMCSNLRCMALRDPSIPPSCLCYLTAEAYCSFKVPLQRSFQNAMLTRELPLLRA